MAIILTGIATGLHAQNGGEQSRGAMLYSTHCIGCHTTQVHWREKGLVKDWNSLTDQVDRWQSNTGLHWEKGDITDVARYLNALYYHFPSEAGNNAAAVEQEQRR